MVGVPTSYPRDAQKLRLRGLLCILLACLIPLFAGAFVDTRTAQAVSVTSTATPTVDTDMSFFDESDTPAEVTVDDPRAIEVGLQFSVDVDGYVTGVRFYKSPMNSGRHVGTLWDAAGKRLGRVGFSEESPSGWQHASFTTPIRVSKGETYTVSYSAPGGHFSTTRRYFADTGRTSGALRTEPNAGVFRYGKTRAVPRSTYLASNFWVDVTFRAESQAQPPLEPDPVAGTRDVNVWPFSTHSIWNMPIGNGARYLPLGLTPPTEGYGTDEVYLTFDPGAPLRKLVDRGYWWPWHSGTSATGSDTGIRVRVPDNWIVEPPPSGNLPNRASAALQEDGRAREFQYTVRPHPGSDVSMFEYPRAVFDLRGDGLTPDGMFGAHGGSGLTGIGGTIREGELSGAAPIRHALAVTMNMAKWGTPQGGNITNGYRWPAIASDSIYADPSYSVGYGTIRDTGGSSKDGLGMGTLLAIPPDVDLSSLNFETPQGAKIAWTHQNYGAYVVDNSHDPDGKWDMHLLNVEIGVLQEFPAISTWPGTDTPFGRDMNKIFTRLAVVDNNGPTSIGGGGTPRQPLAPRVTN